MDRLVFVAVFIMSNVATFIVTDKYSAHSYESELAQLKLNLSEAEVDLYNIGQCVKRRGTLRYEEGQYRGCVIK